MSRGVWDVAKDEGRVRWEFAPPLEIGPLRLGMSPDEVAEVLAEPGRLRFGGGVPAGQCQEWYREVGVTAYYASGQLACVAVDALSGPRVTLDGTSLVARVPAELDDWIFDYTRERGLDLRYIHEGSLGSADLGVLLRVQRAGNVLLTRPLFLLREWVVNSWDWMPGSEWMTP
jgi:hypothetical protein